ncbi:MAG: NeuD/PglB/VioB family sugar acetyltransferase [Marinoscillum sp.]
MLDNIDSIYLVGYSGHAYVVLTSLIQAHIPIKGYLSKTKEKRNPFNLTYCGSERDEEFEGWSNNSAFVLGIGDNFIRRKVGELIRSRNKRCLSLIDNRANIAPGVTIKDGTFVSTGAIINTFSTIEHDVIVNTGAIIEHECEVGSGAHIAPGVVLLGNVKIGKNTFIGANSVVRQGLSIGDNVVVGAGSVVVNNIESNTKVVGNPAKRLLI